MNLDGKKVMIVGFARSGVGAAKLLCEKGANVTINDIKPRSLLKDQINMLVGYDVRYELEQKADEYVKDCDLIVVSPGVPTTLSFFDVAKDNGVKVIGEMELGYRFAKCPITAITGTNGKTTTTALLGAIYEKAGLNTFVAGNIGESIAACALETKKDDAMVLEVSSFQLETTDKFKPHVACILNIAPDHLDRHKTMEGYINAKTRIFLNQDENDYAVLNYNDKYTSSISKHIKSKILYFSLIDNVKNGVCIKSGKIVFCIEGKDDVVIARPEEIRLPGRHNLENSLAAICMAMAFGIEPHFVRHTLATFSGVEHRLETVSEINGIRFINDSKGTNPASTICAIESMETPTVLILGGYDKDIAFDELASKVTKSIESIVVLGQTSKKIADSLLASGYGSIYYAQDFKGAVYRAYELAKPGYTVLLSPACASYDMFNDYEERGRYFKKIVKKIEGDNG
jgi:UDP-N-acetylmuramoylalanine--D-glutamate ligase